MSVPRSLHRSPERTKPPISDAPDALGLSTAHICTLLHHRGGSYAEIKPPGGKGARIGGGTRAAITAFSPAARRRMLRLMATVDSGAICVPLFVTLTYPDHFPPDSRTWKDHLRAFRERLKRRWGKFPGIWRLELMDRKSGASVGLVAPHFHLLLFLEVNMLEFAAWLSAAWAGVVGSDDPNHLKAGTSVALAETWKGARGYLSKYVAKTETLKWPDGVGRLWGVWYRDLLPIEAVMQSVGAPDFIKLRRVMRRFAGLRSTSQLRGLGCFVDFTTTTRLLRWLGYYPGNPPDRPAGGASGAAVRCEAASPGAGPRDCAGRAYPSLASGGG